MIDNVVVEKFLAVSSDGIFILSFPRNKNQATFRFDIKAGEISDHAETYGTFNEYVKASLIRTYNYRKTQSDLDKLKLKYIN